jgi:hypothetical protein
VNDTSQQPQLRELNDLRLGQAFFFSRKQSQFRSPFLASLISSLCLFQETLARSFARPTVSCFEFISVGKKLKLAPVNGSFQLLAFGVQSRGTGLSIFST